MHQPDANQDANQDASQDASQNTAQDAGQDAAPQPWERLPGEPERWFGRFQAYLTLGPTRTLRSTGRCAGLLARNQPYTWGRNWSQAAHRWQWRDRALAWDVHQREVLALSERNLRLGLRQRRVAIIEEYLETVRAVLDNANLPAADEDLARQWLPQMRVFLRDLLAAQRQEFERDDLTPNDSGNRAITADDLRAAQRALEGGESGSAGMPGAPALAPRLFVCAAPESAFLLDLAVLRGVRSATGLQFSRLLDATRRNFEKHLRRERGLGRPVMLLHLALHTSPAGVLFTDGLADGNWLSERLLGVRVLLIAGCTSDDLGDWLSVVPYVITLREEISGEDAAQLTQHFWRNIGLGQAPAAALDAALAHCPPLVGEYVVRHW